jgi:hypothetical protein
MNGFATFQRERAPWFIWALMLGLAIIPPLTFAWIWFAPPAGTVPTGVYGVDGAVFVNCMRMFDTNYFTPYASCQAVLGDHSSAYFTPPFFWLYGALGAFGRLIHANEFLLLGCANGLGLFLYLFAVERFLRTVFPRQANLGFVLFAIAGGPGGVMYIASWALGFLNAPNFEPYFYRCALYQLFEGARPSPILAAPRLYYTISMACCFGALTCFLRQYENRSRAHGAWGALLLFAGTLINLRYGVMAWGVMCCYLIADSRWDWRGLLRKAFASLEMFAPTALAWLIGWLLMRRNPMFVRGTMEVVRTHMWLSPFICAMLFHLIAAVSPILKSARDGSRVARVMSCGAMGYLAAYAGLYVLYNAYYGNYLLCLDVTSAMRVSDPALIGAIIGVVYGVVRGGVSKANTSDGTEIDRTRLAWVALWFLVFGSVAISAFGGGWFLRLVPERLMIFLAVPLAVFAAHGIQLIAKTHGRFAMAFVGVMIACGLCSIGVSSACFQGPLGHRPGKGPYGYAHCELMNETDARLIEKIDGGVVLAPVTYGPSFADVLAIRPGVKVLFGFGSMNLGDLDPAESEKEARAFFDASSSDESRRALVERRCVNYVFCPDSHPLPEDMLRALRGTPWLQETARDGAGVLYKIVVD